MLASTVQFSNNDPYPVTHTLTAWYTGTGPKKQAFLPVPSDTQQRARHHPSACSVFHAEAVLTEEASETMPSSQRSTHEQPCRTLACSRLCAP
ncbi:hypothetical protein J2Z30_009940 [Streptomyces iranensis]|uniref:Uncharacterized protein n=1 Tax=Streptomyces iranensis TaxID=576784 RepID=A0ABS4NA18_9ACTN|nr:hypothetical protein [Streptomyces iranensis]